MSLDVIGLLQVSGRKGNFSLRFYQVWYIHKVQTAQQA